MKQVIFWQNYCFCSQVFFLDVEAELFLALVHVFVIT